MLYACKGAYTLFKGQSERERQREKDRERERKRVNEKEGGGEREREYLFLKVITGALATFSHLVEKYCSIC